MEARHGERRGGIARNDNHLRLLSEQEAADLDTVTLDRCGALAAVGHAGGIADVENILRGRSWRSASDDCEAADARSQKPQSVAPGWESALLPPRQWRVDEQRNDWSGLLGAAASDARLAVGDWQFFNSRSG
jgi:hypothetical protein